MRGQVGRCRIQRRFDLFLISDNFKNFGPDFFFFGVENWGFLDKASAVMPQDFRLQPHKVKMRQGLCSVCSVHPVTHPSLSLSLYTAARPVHRRIFSYELIAIMQPFNQRARDASLGTACRFTPPA